MQPCPVLIINLPSSAARRAAMASQCARLGLAVEFIAAVNGRALDAAQRAACCAESFAAFHSPLTGAEVGCYLSHLKALQYLVDHDCPWAVVLEDDVRLPADFATRLTVLCQEADPTFDLIKLNGHLPRRLVLQVLSNGDRLVRFRRPPINANAHLWSLAGARKLLARGGRVRRPIDVEIKHWWEIGLRVVTLAPALVTLDPALCQASTIGVRNVRTAAGWYRKLRYNIAYSLASRYQLCRDAGWAHGLRLLLPF